MDSGTNNHHHLDQEEKEKINETVVSVEQDEQEVSSKSKIEEKERENTTITGEGDGDPTADDVDIMIDIDGDDLIFFDDAVFPCLSSPTASSASNLNKKPSISNSSSSSSSSSAWSFLAVSGQPQEPHMQSSDVMVPTPSEEATATETDMMFGDIELWDTSNPLDPSFLFPDDYDIAVHDPLPPHCCDPSTIATTEDDGDSNNDNNNLSDELAKIFLEWLKSNRDSISPEDLRSIKLKKSTVECAAARLGGGKQGRTQLLKLILAWVQNHHLQKKKRRLSRHETKSTETTAPFYNNSQSLSPPPAYPHYQFPFLSDATGTNPNPSLDYSCCEPSWTMHYPVQNPIPVSALPCISEAQVYQSAPVAPYHYYQSASTSSIVVNSHPFSPSPDFGHVFSPTPMHFSPFAGGPGLQPIPHYSGGYNNSQHSMYPSPTLTGAASATKEARKKRMARQRRFSALHQHRSHQIHNNQHSSSTAAVAAAVEKANLRAVIVSEGGSSSAAHDNNNNSKNRAFWSSARQKSLPTDGPFGSAPLPAKSSNTQQPRAQSRNASSLDKRKGLKSENLRFLLQKVLKQSDVGSLGRIVLPKKEAEIHLPELDARDGISIPMEDIGTSRVWNMKYRFWPNNKSRMYLLENTGDFVRSNGLQEGDFIVIYLDVKCNKYMIRGVKVRQQLEPKGAGGSRLDAAKAYQLKKNSSDLVHRSSNTSRNEAAACYDSVNYENENNVVELPCYIEEDEDDAICLVSPLV